MSEERMLKWIGLWMGMRKGWNEHQPTPHLKEKKKKVEMVPVVYHSGWSYPSWPNVDIRVVFDVIMLRDSVIPLCEERSLSRQCGLVGHPSSLSRSIHILSPIDNPFTRNEQTEMFCIISPLKLVMTCLVHVKLLQMILSKNFLSNTVNYTFSLSPLHLYTQI